MDLRLNQFKTINLEIEHFSQLLYDIDVICA